MRLRVRSLSCVERVAENTCPVSRWPPVLGPWAIAWVNKTGFSWV